MSINGFSCYMTVGIKNGKVVLCALMLGIGAALLSLTAFGTYLEEEFGLPWLFKIRGSTKPAEQVIIISIDKRSAEILHLPDNPEKWPRSYYAQLIEKLNQQQPSIIAFNMTFGESRDPDNDQLLAEAMAKGRNIVLSNYLKQSSLRTVGVTSQFMVERIIDPLPILEQAALFTAPFPLPKTASTVKQFWTYKKSAGDISTFPNAVFQCFVFKQTYPEIIALLHQLEPALDLHVPDTFDALFYARNAIEIIQQITNLIISDSETINRFTQLVKKASFSIEKKQLLNAWVALLKQSSSLYFNHYGPAGTIPSIPFYQALMSEVLKPDLFRNKIVLVGYSETIEPEKNQGFYTVFSHSDNDVISPIEIAATAVGNLIDHNWLKPLPSQRLFILILGWSILLVGACTFSSYRVGVGLVALLNLVYITVAYTAFRTNATWIPLFIPVMLLTPLVLIVKSIVYFLKGKQEHTTLHKAFSLYLPDSVVKSMAKNHDMRTMNHFGELMPSVCMATDAEQYTTLSENMKPEKLNALMNEYYSVMFPLVKKYRGIITDVIGDAMFAVWGGTQGEIQARTNACQAALDIKMAIDGFNDAHIFRLPTRLGLHFGEIRLGNVGAADHYEYRAVGDTVNTTTRIEGLNKYLGTQVLVSAEVIDGLAGFLTRELGFFVLKGKTRPIQIYELIGPASQTALFQQAALSGFSKALGLFQQHKWSEALHAWYKLDHDYPGDGPTLFYLNYLNQNRHLRVESAVGKQPVVIKMGDIMPHLAFENKTSIE